MDKVQKIREEVVRMHNLLPIMDGDNISVNYADRICTTLEMYIDSMQEEPKECMYSKGNYIDEDRKVLCDGCQEECKFKPVEWSEKDDSILKEIIDSVTACDATTGTISVCFEKHEAKVRWLKSLKERFNK